MHHEIISVDTTVDDSSLVILKSPISLSHNLNPDRKMFFVLVDDIEWSSFKH